MAAGGPMIPKAADHTVVVSHTVLENTVAAHIPMILDIVDLTTLAVSNPMILDTTGPIVAAGGPMIPKAADHTILITTVAAHIPLVPDIVDLITVEANNPIIPDTVGPIVAAGSPTIPEAADHTVVASHTVLENTVAAHIHMIPDMVDLTTVAATNPMIPDTAAISHVTVLYRVKVAASSPMSLAVADLATGAPISLATLIGSPVAANNPMIQDAVGLAVTAGIPTPSTVTARSPLALAISRAPRRRPDERLTLPKTTLLAITVGHPQRRVLKYSSHRRSLLVPKHQWMKAKAPSPSPAARLAMTLSLNLSIFKVPMKK